MRRIGFFLALVFILVGASVAGAATGSISGTVTDSGTGAPLFNLFVNVCPTGGGGCTGSSTDAAGHYQVTGLAPGTYYVNVNTFGTEYIEQYYNNEPDQAHADPVTVTSGVVTPNIDFPLIKGGSISGTVTDNATALPLSSVTVTACPSGGGYCSSAVTNASGLYTIQGLPAGSYIVSTSPDLYVPQYYNNASSAASATPVSVTLGVVTSSINFSLKKGGSISGTVTDSSTHLAISGLSVNACTLDGSFCKSATTDSLGAYTVTGLAGGNYYVNTHGGDYMTTYYNGVYNIQSATPVAVTLGSPTSNINFSLTKGGAISGKVTDAATGAGIPAIYVSICKTDGSYCTADDTDSSGNYRIAAIPAGSYYVFSGGASTSYATQYWNHVANQASATPVTVSLGAEVSTINFALLGTGSISGTVTDSTSGSGVSGITVTVMNSTQSVFYGSAVTSASGAYTVSGLTSGSGYVVTAQGNTTYATMIQRNISVSAPTPTVVNFALLHHAPSKIGVFYNGYWYLDSNMSWAWDGTPTDTLGIFGIGLTGAIPVVGDWNGDGTTKIGVYMNGTWYLDMNRNWQWDGEPTDKMYTFGAGLPDAIPVVGDWNGDGITKIGIYSDGMWYLDMNGNGQWDGEPTDVVASFGVGLSGAVPVVGDWNGDGATKIGIYQNGYWYLDVNGNGIWEGAPNDQLGVFGIGLTNAVPVVGDWNADGIDEIGIYQQGYWYLDKNRSWQWEGEPTDQFGIFGVGLTGAVPVPGKW